MFQYFKSETFFTDFTSLLLERQEQGVFTPDDIVCRDFWTNWANRCFCLKPYYFAVANDRKTRISTPGFNSTHHHEECHQVNFIEAYILAGPVIEFHAFVGQNASIKLGREEIIKFEVSDEKIKVTGFSTILF